MQTRYDRKRTGGIFMFTRTTVITCFLLCAFVSEAQTAQVPFIRATGTGTVSVQPDQAMVSIGVTTQAQTAADASAQNASQVAAVLAQLKTVLGAGGEIKTINYSLNPNYVYPQGGVPTLTGFTANNTVQVTTSDLAGIGKVIDAAAQAGANRIDGLQFTLKDSEPPRRDALKAASIQARAHADSVAAGLGVRTGAVVAAQEGGSSPTPILAGAVSLTPSTPTPVQTGPLTIQATVTADFAIVQ
jgi:uncharacterized protein YggE